MVLIKAYSLIVANCMMVMRAVKSVLINCTSRLNTSNERSYYSSLSLFYEHLIVGPLVNAGQVSKKVGVLTIS